MTDDGIADFNSYASNVVEAFSSRFRAADNQFTGWKRLIENFCQAVGAVRKHGTQLLGNVNAMHNELCIADAILADTTLQIRRLDYEPRLRGCSKSIDFRVIVESMTLFIDVKTIQPEWKDKWNQYEKAKKENWIPENIRVHLSKNGMGGKLWHSLYTARARVLEYALELEEKIAEAGLIHVNAKCILALCGNGFDWRKRTIEDFVSSYYGRYCADDPFSKMERKKIEERKISLQRNISGFAFMSRSNGRIHKDNLVYFPRISASALVHPSCGHHS